MENSEVINLIQQQLPDLISQNPQVRDLILRTVSNYYAPKQETESRFDQILEELRQDREEQARKFDKIQEQIEQNVRRIDQTVEEIKALHKKYDITIGALGSRCDLYSEESFRYVYSGMLQDLFGVQVLHLSEYDDSGEVFGRPDQIELDIIIKNDLLMVCEMRFSTSKAEMYSLERKVNFYEKRHQQKVNRKIVISPIIDDQAKPITEMYGIEIYSYPDSVVL
jgi:hypothetical protein